MPWKSKRKWYAAHGRTWWLTRWEGQRHTDPIIVRQRHAITLSPLGFTRQTRLAAFRIRNEIEKLHLNWQEAHSHIPPTLDINPIRIETTIEEQEVSK